MEYWDELFRDLLTQIPIHAVAWAELNLVRITNWWTGMGGHDQDLVIMEDFVAQLKRASIKFQHGGAEVELYRS
jgi:hypothetical protein